MTRVFSTAAAWVNASRIAPGRTDIVTPDRSGLGIEVVSEKLQPFLWAKRG